LLVSALLTPTQEFVLAVRRVRYPVGGRGEFDEPRPLSIADGEGFCLRDPHRNARPDGVGAEH
jgi:hypothetical protein